MRLPKRSPSGQPTCPSAGPLDADIVGIAESPAGTEIRKQEPLVGQAGRTMDKCLVPAGVRRSDMRLVNVVPARAPGDTFARHSAEDIAWGLEQLRAELRALEPPRSGRRVVVLMGANPLRVAGGWPESASITDWRGSLIPPAAETNGDVYNQYWTRYSRSPVDGLSEWAVMPTYHPAGVMRRFEWHTWMINDFRRALRYTRGEDFERRQRQWYLEPSVEDLDWLVDECLIRGEGMVAVDTEMDPLITALVSEEYVFVFTWRDEYRPALRRLMASERVLKVAHNMAHDWRQFEKIYDVPVRPPWFDSIAGAQILQPSGGRRTRRDAERAMAKAGQQILGKRLSPHISAEYTAWPYHKWLAERDMLAYCGMDTVVAYDAYWPQIRKIYERPKLRAVAEQDHRLFEVLFRASAHGLRVDTDEWLSVCEEYEYRCQQMQKQLELKAWPLIEEALDDGKLRKPHLFREWKQCPCCGGGSAKTQQCWSCAGFDAAPRKTELEALHRERHGEEPSGKLLKADLEELLLEPCERCDAKGQVLVVHGISFSSDDQVRDLFYRALAVPPRRHKGKVTTRKEQLARTLEDGGYLAPDCPPDRRQARDLMRLYVDLANLRGDLQNIAQLEPDDDGRVRCVFDLWYTPTHRVASREGLLDKGTNLQNVPKRARRFIVPDEGEFFLYPDYAQIEGRCQAVLSGDERLLEIYRSGKDSHMEVVRLLREQVGIEITRDQAKRVSYAAFYDIEAPHLADILGITHRQALQALKAFFQVFRGVARYKSSVERELRESRSVTSPTGWVRKWLGYVVETRGRRKGQVRKKIHKEALATNPQNMAAWVMAEGLLRVWDEARWMRPQLHVHDSALLGVAVDRGPEAIRTVERLMHVSAWEMPFPVEAVCGPNWWAASVDDDKKPKHGLEDWTRDAVLANGVPAAA